MGMYNELNKINQSINQQATTQRQKSIEKYKTENNLLIKLEYFIKKYKNNNKDIYNINVQDEIIQKSLHSCFGTLLQNEEATTPEEFVNNYTLQDERIDSEYYYIYCMRHYLQCCRNVEKYLKNKEEQGNYKKQIAIEKWQLQRKKMQLQIERERQKINTKQQKEAAKIEQQKAARRQRIMQNTECAISSIVKVMLYIAIAPIFTISFIFTGFLGRYDERKVEKKA